MFSCRMVGLQYELALVSHPEKDVLYQPFHVDTFGQGSILLPPWKYDGLDLFVSISSMVSISFYDAPRRGW